MRKNEKVGKYCGLHNGAIRGLHIETGFRDYRSKQEGVQIGAALEISNQGKRLQIGTGISNRGKEISNQGGDYK